MKPNKKFQGYSVVDVRSGEFIDSNGKIINGGYEIWDSIIGPNEILEEIDWIIENRNSKFSRKLKRIRKFFKVVKVFNVVEEI